MTFGTGYSQAATITPLNLTINPPPSSTSRGGAEETGTTVTIATSAAHRLQVGDTVTVTGVAVAGYNGTFTVTAVPSTRSFQYTNAVTGLPVSGSGTATPAIAGASSSGTTATIKTAAPHNRAVGDMITISGVNQSGYNGTFAITAVPSPTTFQYTIASQQPNGGGGTATYYSPFQVRIDGNDSAVVGGSGLPYNNANLTAAINAISGFPGTVAVSGAAAPGFTIAYSGASAGLDVSNVEIVNLSCGGCSSSVQETNHGAGFDSFRLNYDGNVSGVITNGTNYTAAALKTAIEHFCLRATRSRLPVSAAQRSTTRASRSRTAAARWRTRMSPCYSRRRTSLRGRPVSLARPTRAARSTTEGRSPRQATTLRWSRFPAARRSRCGRRLP